MDAKTTGITSVAGHRVEALGEEPRASHAALDMRGLLIPVVLFYKERDQPLT